MSAAISQRSEAAGFPEEPVEVFGPGEADPARDLLRRQFGAFEQVTGGAEALSVEQFGEAAPEVFAQQPTGPGGAQPEHLGEVVQSEVPVEVIGQIAFDPPSSFGGFGGGGRFRRGEAGREVGGEQPAEVEEAGAAVVIEFGQAVIEGGGLAAEFFIESGGAAEAAGGQGFESAERAEEEHAVADGSAADRDHEFQHLIGALFEERFAGFLELADDGIAVEVDAVAAVTQELFFEFRAEAVPVIDGDAGQIVEQGPEEVVAADPAMAERLHGLEDGRQAVGWYCRHEGIYHGSGKNQRGGAILRGSCRGGVVFFKIRLANAVGDLYIGCRKQMGGVCHEIPDGSQQLQRP